MPQRPVNIEYLTRKKFGLRSKKGKENGVISLNLFLIGGHFITGDFMRRFKQQLPEQEAIDILKQHTSGVLSLVDDQGRPYGVPLNYAYVDGRLLFHCAKAGRKLEAARHCGYGSFCVIHQDEIVMEKFANAYVSVIAEGPLREVEDKKAAIEAFMDVYVPRDYPGLKQEIEDFLPQLVMLEMELETISGKEAKLLMEARNS